MRSVYRNKQTEWLTSWIAFQLVYAPLVISHVHGSTKSLDVTDNPFLCCRVHRLWHTQKKCRRSWTMIIILRRSKWCESATFVRSPPQMKMGIEWSVQQTCLHYIFCWGRKLWSQCKQRKMKLSSFRNSQIFEPPSWSVYNFETSVCSLSVPGAKQLSISTERVYSDWNQNTVPRSVRKDHWPEWW